MREDVAYHYPPDLIEMMVSTTILLTRSKPALCTFFESAGIPRSALQSFRDRVLQDRASVKMAEIARSAIEMANRLPGDPGLRARRELIRRVVQFTDFEQCYEEKRHEARSRVASVSDYVNQHSRLTRLLEAQDRETAKTSKIEREKRAKEAERIAARQGVEKSLAILFTMTDPQKRGKLLEGVLNNLFKIDGVSVREAFEFRSDRNGEILEQVDGVIELDGHFYLVEMKWWSTNLGRDDIASHMVRVHNRRHTRGIFIAYPGYTSAAIDSVKTASISGSLFVLADLEEVVEILRNDVSVTKWLKPKIETSILDRNPFRKYSN